MPTFSARVHRTLIRVYIRFTSNETSINLVSFIIEEFPIIGFYLYHVTSAGQSSNWTTSGIKQHILAVDLTL